MELHVRERSHRRDDAPGRQRPVAPLVEETRRDRGLDAGFVYNTWPLMEGRLVPRGIFPDHPLWRNAFEDIMTVQFDHRIGAYLVTVLVVALWILVQARRRWGTAARQAANLLLAALVLQVSLGILTLLLVVPVSIAAAHQAGAMLLLSAGLWLAYRLRIAGS